jgi:hypothetical protein
MFPPQLPSVFIRWLTEPGDSVYDPFSGRGTVALEAALAGRAAYASDANPLAAALSGAKVDVPSARSVRARIASLERSFVAPDLADVPANIRMLYSDQTLSQIVFLKNALQRNRHIDRFLTATMLGLLHGNHSSRGATRALSISMPNTFAMAPGYVRRYIATHHLVAPEVDAFEMLRRRIEQLSLPETKLRAGRAWQQDAAKCPPAWLRREKVKLVFTSPPYLQVIKYGKYNWVRLWFLGADPKAVDQELVGTGSLERYREFMRSTLSNVAAVLREDGFACLVIGDVRRRDGDLNLALDVWNSVAAPEGWQLHGIVSDRLPGRHKVSRIWKHNAGRATKTDRILIMSRRQQPTSLPPLRPINWTRRSEWPKAAAGRRS